MRTGDRRIVLRSVSEPSFLHGCDSSQAESALMLMVGGSPVAGFNDPQCGTSMPLGPSTPSVGVELSAGGSGSARLAGVGTLRRGAFALSPTSGARFTFQGSGSCLCGIDVAGSSPFGAQAAAA